MQKLNNIYSKIRKLDFNLINKKNNKKIILIKKTNAK